jgi:hypothetical protein
MTQAADTAVVVSLDETIDEFAASTEPGTSEQPDSPPQTAPLRSDGPPPIRPTLW